MKTAWECRAQAAECRALANGAAKGFARELLKMAEIWEGLARDREGASGNPAADALRAYFDHVAHQPVPPELLELLRQLEAAAPRVR